MGAVLRILLLGLAAVSVALVVPRAAGDELQVRIRWDRVISQEMVALSESGGWSFGKGLFAVGRSTLGVFSEPDGEILSKAIRHRAFSSSGDFYINQAGTIADRWVVTNRRTGAVSFHERRGVPRLYGSILAQFATRTITLRDSRYGGKIHLPRRVALSAFDALPGRGDEGDFGFAVLGDLFGEVSFHRLDFKGIEEEQYFLASAMGPVFGIKLISGNTPHVLVVRGRDPQMVELFRYGDKEPRMREEIPPEAAVKEPLAFHEMSDFLMMVGLKERFLVLDSQANELRYSNASMAGAVAAVIPGAGGELLVAAAQDQGLSLALWTLAGFDRPREDRRGPVAWSVPGARFAAAGEDLLVVERNDRFFALEVTR
ncbi:hypothetical protein SAMN05920897_1037 [Alkalispirochaeta americana]|uniref:Uncharacterized protein n=1 Tax=Alkalispirochaeta americana TaxID=159291 RepID=A0A1N6PJU7_9SPIO|nr:hypothetical protein [Alkalispirochaeta americana]SIQ04479.1 hypothetical protein SAMN05920897_1037 [Alkalispirochaeta americana]